MGSKPLPPSDLTRSTPSPSRPPGLRLLACLHTRSGSEVTGTGCPRRPRGSPSPRLPGSLALPSLRVPSSPRPSFYRSSGPAPNTTHPGQRRGPPSSPPCPPALLGSSRVPACRGAGPPPSLLPSQPCPSPPPASGASQHRPRILPARPQPGPPAGPPRGSGDRPMSGPTVAGWV